MDYKGFILFIGSVMVNDINELLTTLGLAANFIYIGYQLYSHHKKDKDEK